MLRHVLGDSPFFQILRDFPNNSQFAFKNATTEQFRDFCEDVSGLELDWFFDQWIYSPAYPNYEWGYVHFCNNNSDSLYLKIRQTQNTGSQLYAYKMPIDFEIQYADNSRDTFIVWDSLQTQEFNLPVKEKPKKVVFDPGKWILKTATRLPESQIRTPVDLTAGFHLYQNYPNPFNSYTNIPFALNQSGPVTLEIYDLVGRKVRTLFDDYTEKGRIIGWDGRDDQNRPVASGVYVCRLRFLDQQETRKMLLIR